MIKCDECKRSTGFKKNPPKVIETKESGFIEILMALLLFMVGFTVTAFLTNASFKDELKEETKKESFEVKVGECFIRHSPYGRCIPDAPLWENEGRSKVLVIVTDLGVESVRFVRVRYDCGGQLIDNTAFLDTEAKENFTNISRVVSYEKVECPEELKSFVSPGEEQLNDS